MYDNFLKELIERLIVNHFNETAFKCKIEFNHNTEMIDYEVETVSKSAGVNKYRGYLGCIGNLVVTTINDNRLNKENYIDIT